MYARGFLSPISVLGAAARRTERTIVDMDHMTRTWRGVDQVDLVIRLKNGPISALLPGCGHAVKI